MPERIQRIKDYWRNSRIDEILRLQALINDITPESKLGVMFQRKWGRTTVKISFRVEEGYESLLEYELDTAYWYVQGIADGMCNICYELKKPN